MSVVGFDLGNLNCYIAVARQGGIEVITNDYSLHATPSCVSFGPKTRVMGDAAKQQANTNLNNTVINFKHLIGRRFTDQRTQQIRQWIPCEMIQLPDDHIGLKVNYLGEQRVFTPEQIVAALLVKLKQITENNLREVSKVTDCVVSVPYYFTDAQRRALLAATQMADLNCLRILNESTAVALAYGIYKQDLPAEGEKARNVLFLDVGHAASQAYIVAYNKGKLSMLGAAYDLDAAGRGFDGVLRDHFRHDFKERYNIDAATKPRAWQRLLEECEKLKKQMSANSTPIPINIECFMDDKDVSGKLQR
uniref:Heat shock 70 kDa protein 4 n=1 Tax=Plectus sambesii TaxID=2011161 RepID=A0A914XFT4_9BILA